MIRVYHRYRKTQGILATVITGVGTGCNFSTCDYTTPVSMVLLVCHRLSSQFGHLKFAALYFTIVLIGIYELFYTLNT